MIVTIIVFILALVTALYILNEKDKEKRRRVLMAYIVLVGTMFIYFFLMNGRYTNDDSYVLDKWFESNISVREWIRD